MTDNKKAVCVIVVNFGAGALLLKCLDSIAGQTTRPKRVIVIDNASSDPSFTQARALHPGFEFIALDKNIGFAAANNMGVKMANDCDWIALLNPDATADPRWLESLLYAAIKYPSATFFASRILRASAPDRIDSAGDVYHVSGKAWSRGHNEKAEGVYMNNAEVFGPSGAGAMYRRDIFIEAGGFDESFFCYMEDVDLAFRLRLMGHSCLYVANAVALHEGSVSSGKLSGFYVYHGARNMVWVFLKNMPPAMILFYLPQFLLLNFVSLFAFTAHGRLFSALKAKWNAAAAIPSILRSRDQIQRSRSASLDNILPIMSRGLLTPYRSYLRRNKESG